MTARSIAEVMEALRNVCGSDAEALLITERFRTDASFALWDDDRPLPKADETIEADVTSIAPGDILVFLTGVYAKSRRDPFVWRGYAENIRDGETYDALYVDNRPCHADWLGLKLLTEIAFLYEVRHVHELLASSGLTQAHVHSCVHHLSDKRLALTYRVLDSKMGGRISKAVRPLRSRAGRKMRIEDMVRKLTEDVYTLLQTTWSDSLNAEEHRARLEVTRIATLGAIKQLLRPMPSQ